MIVYNYTKVKRREKRVYSLFNTTISKTGIVMRTIQICGICLGIFSIFGLLFCAITGTFWYNPIKLAEGSATAWFYLIFIGAPIGIGIALNSLKIQNYKLVDYLRFYFTPKIPLNQEGKRVKVDGYKMDTFIERI